MRKQIAAANWKMNLTYSGAQILLNDIIASPHQLKAHHQVIFGVPFPYLQMAVEKLKDKDGVFVAAQNCYNKKSGAFTGETSVEMLLSIGVKHVIIGHSERREYFNESNSFLAEKVNICLENGLTPIFCCGEPLSVREEEKQNEFVATQLKESLYHLSGDEISKIIIAYEPIWAIGTGKTASSQQAQDIQQFIRQQLKQQYTDDVANTIPVLYGGSVKASNAVELFSQQDIDGGLVGGASLQAQEFAAIINALQ